MRLALPAPRLLPATIGVLAAVLGLKAVTLVRTGLPADAWNTESWWATGARASSPAPAPPKPETPKNAGHIPPPPAAATEPVAAQPKEPPITATEKAVLLELRHRRQELDAREAAMAERESLLSAAERKLGSRVDELSTLQGRLELMETAGRQRDDASWQGLVKMYETMKPREAASIFNDLPMPVLIQVLDRMKEGKAAVILAAMTPDRAREVTAALARLRTGQALAADPPKPKPVATPPSPPPPRAKG